MESDVGHNGHIGPRFFLHNLGSYDADYITNVFAEIESPMDTEMRALGRVWFRILLSTSGNKNSTSDRSVYIYEVVRSVWS